MSSKKTPSICCRQLPIHHRVLLTFLIRHNCIKHKHKNDDVGKKNKAGERRDWPKFCFSRGRLQRQVLIVSVEYKNKFWWFVKILKLRLPVKKRIISRCYVEVKLNDSQNLVHWYLSWMSNNLLCKIKYVPVSADCNDVDTY